MDRINIEGRSPVPGTQLSPIEQQQLNPCSPLDQGSSTPGGTSIVEPWLVVSCEIEAAAEDKKRGKAFEKKAEDPSLDGYDLGCI